MTDVSQQSVISSIDPWTLTTFADAIAHIEMSLSNLRILAVNTDFDIPEQRQNYYNNIVQLKSFYERAESLVAK